MQHLPAGPELLGVHGQRTDTDRRRERPGTWKPALGQPSLRRDTRRGPAVVSASLDRDVPAVGQPETEHHRHLPQLEQHVGGFTTQMVQTPDRQPGRQIIQRHTEDCAIQTPEPASQYTTILPVFWGKIASL
ncbi:hypothetical protein AB0L44_42050 [Nonomuraea wenchangensis]|uniref:hypothetical protein n=1 Tax=Nonomuraea wenchangensis TaxID=568860 RepID=UPI00342D35B6